MGNRTEPPITALEIRLPDVCLMPWNANRDSVSNEVGAEKPCHTLLGHGHKDATPSFAWIQASTQGQLFCISLTGQGVERVPLGVLDSPE
jgi:hypothetical protein